jgi:6-methylsalicylate decarboxylase
MDAHAAAAAGHHPGRLDMARVDVHQHVWTTPLLDRLAVRTALPRVRRSGGLTVLHCAGEQPYVIDVLAEDPERRSALTRGAGLDLALVAISSPIGIEALPRACALDLIEAHLEGVGALPTTFAPWGPIALDGIDADDVDALLGGGCVGVSLPAGALAGPDWLELVGPVLERVAARGVPLLVHPGPAPGQLIADASLTEPLWWRALTDYVAQMQAAWLTFASRGRREHPNLAVVFAMLAGLAPMLGERLATRGGPRVDLRDPRTFYETSSYGATAVGAIARLVGDSQLLYGSDRPVIEPIATDRDVRLQINGAALIAPIGAPA